MARIFLFERGRTCEVYFRLPSIFVCFSSPLSGGAIGAEARFLLVWSGVVPIFERLCLFLVEHRKVLPLHTDCWV